MLLLFKPKKNILTTKVTKSTKNNERHRNS